MEGKGKVTRRERFLAEMDAVIPWRRLVKLIEPHYPKRDKVASRWDWRRCCGFIFLQQWFNLSDPQAEDAIYDSESMRRFARVELGEEAVPDETTILRFRHLLEQHRLTQAIFNAISGLLEERRLLLRSGTIVDATIIAAPSSTKNASATRDPEMQQTRKGRNWHFGMKLHIGADKRGIVHTVRATDADVADITQLPELLHGQEREVFGDQAYWKEADREFSKRAACATGSTGVLLPATVERALADDQPGALADPGSRRTRLSRGQATVGFHQSEIPRPGQEPGTSADHVCAGQPLPGPPGTAPSRGQLCAVMRKLRAASSLCDDHRQTNHHSFSVLCTRLS